MTRRFLMIFLIAAAAVLYSSQNSLAITKVARTMNVMEFFGGGSLPVGDRNGLPDFDFLINNRLVDVNSQDIYKNSFHFGLDYGQLRSSHFLLSIGFRYTKHEVQDTIPLTTDTVVTVSGNPSYNQFDIDLNFNYLVGDIMKSSFAPYAGIGLQGGLTSISQKGYDTSHEVGLGLSLNFGADFKIHSSADGRSFLTLSSINNYNFYGSNNRPKYLNIGGGLKYYFRP